MTTKQEETCGGEDSVDVYKIEFATQSMVDEYMGCFMDTGDDGAITNMLTDESMTTEMCRNHCEGTGVVYYATKVRVCAWKRERDTTCNAPACARTIE